MPEILPVIRSIAIASHPKLPEALRIMKKVQAFLEQAGLATYTGYISDDDIRQRVKDLEFDALLVLGGDGTMLRAGQLCGPVGVPILGINVGRFGFLMEISQNKWAETLPGLIEGHFWLENRMMLEASQWRGSQQIDNWIVLNEVAVSRGQLVRPVRLTAHLDGHLLTTYVADALIAATPTGSTAYALAAGGPILPPELRNILLIAVAPHLSVDRAIVLAEGSTVSIVVHTDHQAVISPDGQTPINMEDGDRVEVRASEHTVQFIRFQDRGYFYRNLTQHMNQNPTSGNHR